MNTTETDKRWRAISAMLRCNRCAHLYMAGAVGYTRVCLLRLADGSQCGGDLRPEIKNIIENP